jgi:phage terminase large subunit
MISETSQDVIEFVDPVEMLYMIDESYRNGTNRLYPWQIEILQDFAKESSKDSCYKGVVRAANGSGKDSILIALCTTWLTSRYKFADSVITSASGTQLDNQTCRAIERICNDFNRTFGDMWKINYRHFTFLPGQGEIVSFTTDEAGRAEGWHPRIPGAHLGIFVSEAKSVPEEIFDALHRCNGVSKRLDVSTPGLPQGHFFNACSSPYWKHYHITAFECPHITHQFIEESKFNYGEHHWLYKSMILAEFGSTDESVVIPYHLIYRLKGSGVFHIKEEFNTGGLDLSAGGDEACLKIRCGNKVIGKKSYQLTDTSVLTEQLQRDFQEFQLDHPQSKIWADSGGLGKPIIDQLRARGWSNLRYVFNQSNAKDKYAFKNIGMEHWYHLKRLIELQEIILDLEDEKLVKQLSSRYYFIRPDGKTQLESKLQARAKGHPSPDRADATALCFSDYSSRIILNEDERKEVDKRSKTFTPEVKPKRFFQASEIVKDRQGSKEQPQYMNAGRMIGLELNKNRDKGLFALRQDIEQHNLRVKQLNKQK